MPKTSSLTSIELFSGAGGLALGVAAAGFKHRMLLEYNKHACKTLRANQSAFGGDDLDLIEGDVRAFDFGQLGKVDLLAAGAPCQPFSIGGKHRANEDDRNLFPEVFRAQRQLTPSAVIVENVKGLLRPSLANFVEYITLQLSYPDIVAEPSRKSSDWEKHLRHLRHVDKAGGASQLQYDVHKLLLNAADFGVPQRRERVFFVAIHRDVRSRWIPPVATHSGAALRLAMEVTGEYWLRHGIKRRVAPNHPQLGKWMREAGHTQPWQTVRDAIAGLPSPVNGQEAVGVANHVGQAGARTYPGHTGSPLDAPAKTLKAGVHGVPGGENMLLNPNKSVRYFTVREAARLQTFPDSYVIEGAWGEALRQLGNAVPVKLAQTVAESVLAAIGNDTGLGSTQVTLSTHRERLERVAQSSFEIEAQSSAA